MAPLPVSFTGVGEVGVVEAVKDSAVIAISPPFKMFSDKDSFSIWGCVVEHGNVEGVAGPLRERGLTHIVHAFKDDKHLV